MRNSLVIGLLAVWAAAGVGAAGPPADGRFRIVGNRVLSSEEIAEALESAACHGADSLCLKSMCDSVAYLYWSQGYVDAVVTCAGGEPGGVVEVEISEGDLSTVAGVEITGVSDEGRAIIEPIFKGATGKPFSSQRLESYIRAALLAYDRAAYPAATIVPEVAATDGGGLELIIRVREGPRAVIRNVEFEGSTETRRGVLLRETGLKPGEPYDGSKVEEARRNLERLGVFETVSEPRLRINPRDSSLSVTFEVVEARTSFLEGVLAYGPRANGNELFGQVMLDLRNIGGTLRKAGVYWMKRGGGRTAWSVRYREPRILTLPLGLEGSIDSDVDETAYERRKFELRLVEQDGRRFELRAGWFLASVREGPLLEDDPAGDLRTSYRENGLDLGLMYDATDRVVNPTRGTRADLQLEFSTFKCTDCDQPDRKIWSGLVSASRLFGIAGRTVGFLGGRFEAVNAGEGTVPPSHLFRVGGLQSLRGYPEEWFAVERALVLTVEIRYIVGPSSRLYLFLDAGFLGGSSHESEGGTNYPAGYGFGLTTGSRIGVFRIEVASARGEPLGEAKLHLGLVQRF
jgi:outer membrane protein assembly factor BamA